MNEKINFTKTTLNDLPIPEKGKRKKYYDSKQKNLVVVVYGSGKKTFFVRKNYLGSKQDIYIGPYPEIGPEQARKIAITILASLAQGENPQDARRERRQAPTIAELYQNYIDGHVKDRCKRAYDMEQDFRRYMTDWKSKKVFAVTRPQVHQKVLNVKRKFGSSAANKVIIIMKAAYNWNIKHGYLEGDNPFAGIPLYKIKSRERFLKPEELKRFFKALNAFPNQTLRDYVRLSLYTGARRANVLAMSWNQIDFDLGLWTIPITKNGDSQTIPLTTAALTILRDRHDKVKGEYVFPGKEPGTHLVEPKWHWYKLLEKAEIENLRLHDLRRTLGSYMAMNNTSLQMIAKALGHKSTAATQIYARLSFDPIRNAMESAQSNMFEAAGLNDTPDNVVEMHPEGRASS